MKKVLFLLLILSGATQAQAPAHPDYGRAAQLQGKYVFFHSAPVKPYERAFSFIDNPTFKGCPNAQDIATAALALARAEGQEQQKDFDAIIIQPGERDLAITFKTASEDNGLERAEQREGKYTFILAAPITEYNVVTDVKSSAYNVSLLTKETCLNTEQMLLNIIKKADKKKPYDAVIYNGTTSQLIKFK